MAASNRRTFLQGVGSGMLIAGLGSNLALDLGVASAADLRPPGINPRDDLGPWITRMQEMAPDQLQVKMAEELAAGNVDLRQLTAAAALANAETFGGQDYVGYHAEMALVPALEMSRELPAGRQALPVLKVLYRNSARIQQFGPQRKTLQPIAIDSPARAESVDQFGPELRRLVRDADMDKAEELFYQTIGENNELAFNTLLYTIADEVDVHRFVLAYRGMSLIDVAGLQHSHTLLRQCVRHCVDFETNRKRKGKPESPIRQHLPHLVDEYKLASSKPGTRMPDDEWVERFAMTIYNSSKFDASTAVAEALSDGIAPAAICEAISLAANQLTLRQPGNPLRTHGASAGVHGSDAANAWRHMTGHANDFNKQVGLLVSAWHTGRYQEWQHDPYPLEDHFEKVTSDQPQELLGICEEAIRGNDQPTAAAAMHRYGEGDQDPRPAFDLLLRYAISEDGRLHSEKYYRTVAEEFALARPAFRWRHLVGLARVTASAFAYDVEDNHGHRAPGYEQACELLGLDG
ncbi:MAG: hypothetical protein ACR2NP_08985 [Pirellulaceae bacterium]